MKLIAPAPGLSLYRTKTNSLEKDNSSDTGKGVSQKASRQPKTGSFTG
jgi:hypothetical protein